MSDPDFVTLAVERDELQLGWLDVIPSNGYYITRDGIGPGGLDHDKVHATSPFVDGDFLVHKRKTMQNIPLSVNVKATSASQLHSRIATLTEAFEQFQYVIQVVIDGKEFVWTCETANWSIGSGGAWEDLKLRSYIQTVSLDVPRFPY